jgi:serine/threonine protein kinase
MADEHISVNRRPKHPTPYKNGESSPLVGSLLGNYRLGPLIGSGNFGQVHIAEHVHLGGRRAIKIFKRNRTDDKALLNAFARSARLLASLKHPNIVGFHDYGTTDEIAYLVMDLVEPGVALDLFPERPPLATALTTLVQVARALEFAHATVIQGDDGRSHTGVYHGDVKPSNILLGADRPYLTDFMLPNLPIFVKRNPAVQPLFPFYCTEAYGTPMYMAPEQLGGVVNASTDIFSFGVVAYELLTGYYPWDNGHEFRGDHRRMGYHPPVTPVPPRERNHRVPDNVSALVISCIELHSGDRPSSMHEVVEILQESSLQPVRTPDQGEQSVHRYDVALSFAGTERPIAQELYERLKAFCHVFYDKDDDAIASLWGGDLSTALHTIYSGQAKFCIALVSREYVDRAWTSWERRAILQRMVMQRDVPYLLPVIIDDVSIPGLPTSVGTLRWADYGTEGIVSVFRRKLRGESPAA